MEEEVKTDYSAWSQEKLIERVTQLEEELKNNSTRCFSDFNCYFNPPC